MTQGALHSSSQPLILLCDDCVAQNLEKDIETLGAQRDALNDKLVALASSGANLANIEATSTELAALSDKIDAFEARWLELAEIAGDI